MPADGALATLDGAVAVSLKFDFAKGGAVQGAIFYQDITPSDADFKASQPGFADSSPYSFRAYTAQTGSIGKRTEEQAPGDTARTYLSSLALAPGRIAAPLAYPGDYAAVPAATDTTTWDGSVWATFEGPGIIGWIGGFGPAGVADRWWAMRWDSTGHAWTPYKRVNGGPNPMAFIAYQGLRSYPRVPMPRFAASGNHVWVPAGPTGAVDITTAYPQAAQNTGSNYFTIATLGDIAFTFARLPGASTGIRVTACNVDTLAPLAPNPILADAGETDIHQDLPTSYGMWNPVVLDGAIYLCDDKAAYKIVYDENNQRILIALLHSFMRVTGDPAVYHGVLYVPTGNRFWTYKPGSYDWPPVGGDDGGTLPPPYSGTIYQTLATADGLYFTVVDEGDPPRTALMKVDVQGSTTVARHCDWSTERFDGAYPLVWFYEQAASSNTAVTGICMNLGTFGAGSTVRDKTRFRVFPIYDTVKDPQFLAAAARPQKAGPDFLIEPFDSGTAYADAKHLFRVGVRYADLSNTYPARLYYQLDESDAAADDLDTASGGSAATISKTVMYQQGAWHYLGTLNASTPGATVAAGVARGYATFALATPPTHRRLRPALEINGDPTGATYPRVLGFTVLGDEVPTKYYLWTVRCRVGVDDVDAADIPGWPHDADAAYAMYQTLLGWSRAGTLLNFTDHDGDTRMVKITKFRANYLTVAQRVFNLLRRTKGYQVTMALQEVASL